MKKIYMQPEAICCELHSKMMMAVLSGTTIDPNKGATTVNISGEDELNNDVKVITDINIWTDEW